ncbi:MAG: hypothetical protein ACRDUX_16260 [Mycobacterium sp.]
MAVLWHRVLPTGDPITDELAVRLTDPALVPFVAPRRAGNLTLPTTACS